VLRRRRWGGRDRRRRLFGRDGRRLAARYAQGQHHHRCCNRHPGGGDHPAPGRPRVCGTRAASSLGADSSRRLYPWQRLQQGCGLLQQAKLAAASIARAEVGFHLASLQVRQVPVRIVVEHLARVSAGERTDGARFRSLACDAIS
jgi:hypothetical protein